MSSNVTKNLIAQIEEILQREIKLHKDYQALVEQEREAMSKRDLEVVSQTTTKRGQLHYEFEELKKLRISTMKRFPGAEGMRLTTLIQERIKGPEQKRLTSLLNQLKECISSTQTSVKEFYHISRFSLGLVNSTMSIIWSANNGTTKTYSKQGKVSERYLPGKSLRTASLGSA